MEPSPNNEFWNDPTKAIQVAVPRDTWTRLKFYVADKKGLSMGTVVAEAVAQYLDKQERDSA